jgi:hypothetical protein
MIDKLRQVYELFLTIIVIFYICPLSTVLILIIYSASDWLHLNRQSTILLDVKTNLLEKHNKLYAKYSRANTNMFEYVIHYEKNKLIQITNQLKIDTERQ